MTLSLATDPAPHLLAIDSTGAHELHTNQATDVLQTQLLEQLRSNPQPVPTVRLRERLGRRKADIIRALDQLRLRGSVHRTSAGWTAPDHTTR